jgi:tetrahydromethanopterin S-methyltransferase subunit G
VQTTQPRDIGILTLVIGLFVILFVVSLVVGPPATFG